MTGYYISALRLEGKIPFVMASPAEIKERYSIPSAFKAYLDASELQGDQGGIKKLQ
jgi:hypothetical protein